jgi:hypothetical protein
MKLRFLKHAGLRELRSNIPKNLERYRTGEFKELLEPGNLGHLYFELSEGEVDEAAFTELLPPEKNDLKEAHNARVLYGAFKGMSPYQARDERLWTYLCHTLGLQHIRRRHKRIFDKDPAVAAAEIEKVFFVIGGQRGFERTNALARLWSYASIAGRNDGWPLEKTLEVFLYQTDVRAQLVERPSTFVNPNVFSAVMRFMRQQYEDPKKKDRFFNRKEGEIPLYRQLLSRMNEMGGVMMLASMPEKELDQLVGKAASEVGI